MTREQKICSAALLLIVLAFAAAPFLMTTEYRRVSSPDGRYYAVVTCPLWESLVPAFPGQGGDKSGRVTIYTQDGKSCGSAPLSMVSMFSFVEWKGTTAEVPMVATWDLVKRRVTSSWLEN